MKVFYNLAQLTLMLLLAMGSSLPFAQAQSILFIGNSYTYGARSEQTQRAGGVPELFARIARQNGHAPQIQMVAPGGTTLRQHFNNNHGEIDAIRSKKWDYVVLQGHSLEATPAASHPGEFLEYGAKLAAVIRQNNPATKIILYETWAYPKGHPIFPGKFAEQTQMLAQIADGYRKLSREIGAVAVAPVGDAFAEAQNGPHHYNMYPLVTDHHSNDTGYMLSALVFVRTIYGSLPTEPKPVIADLTAEDMRGLAFIADAAVRAWQHTPSPDKKSVP